MTAELDKLNSKFEDKLKRKAWQLDNAAGWNRLADAAIVGEKERTSGCFSAMASVLVIAAVIVKVLL